MADDVLVKSQTPRYTPGSIFGARRSRKTEQFVTEKAYLVLTGSDWPAGAALVVDMVDSRLLEELSRLRKVLVLVRSLLRPFSFFSSLGAEGAACEGELMMSIGCV